MAVRKLGMPLADLARGGNEHSRSGVCHRAGGNNYPELPISADTLKLIYFFKSVPPFRPGRGLGLRGTPKLFSC
jgi:hypothetical protein